MLDFEKIRVLGHGVGQEKLHPCRDKVKKIQIVSDPQNKKQLRSFLGNVGYYRRFILNFSVNLFSLLRFDKKDFFTY